MYQYELLVKNPHWQANEPEETVQTFYRQLQYNIKVMLPHAEVLNITNKQRFLIACVEPCNTEGQDATHKITTYQMTTTEVFIDIQAISCIVG